MAREICIQPCPPTQTFPQLTVPFMGGAIKAASDLTLAGGCDGCELIGNMMIQLSPMMGAMGMPLCLLGCIGAVMQAVQAVPDSLGPPPDPSALIKAIANMLDKCKCVLEMAMPPPVGAICQFLKMVRDIVVLISSGVTCMVGLITHLTTMNARVAALLGSPVAATRNAGLCLQSQVQGMSDELTTKMGPIQAMFLMIQPIFDLLGAVVPPPFNDVIQDIKNGFIAFDTSASVGAPASDVLDALTALSDVLETAATAFVTIVSVCP